MPSSQTEGDTQPPSLPERADEVPGSSSSAAPGSGSIHGEVVDAGTGAPVARVRIDMGSVGGGAQSFKTTTGADGRFVLEDVPAGKYRWWVQKSGYLRAQGGGRTTLRNRPTNVIVVQAKQSLRLRVPLVPASVLLGRVHGPDGEPMEGAHVSLYSVPYPGARPRQLESSVVSYDAG